ncbi:MAG: hypothetical protein LBV41_08170 [Cytophagaceae bacterium]|nr:hypothetical protein [Cytophagaceae bacterium]
MSVYYWNRKFGAQVESVTNDKLVEVMDLDELHTYVGRKKLYMGLDLS